MFNLIVSKLFGSRNERFIKKLKPQIDQIAALEPEMEKLTDEQFPQKIAEYKEQVAAGTSLDDILVEVFALVREAGKRSLEMRHYDVQMVGGMVLHSGRIAEMKTGEGKTLVATLPAVLNALSGKGVHLITVNDYLAKRDAEWMGKLYNFLGLTVGVVVHGLSDEERQEAYGCDITYGTNNEFGFDYLRDNMKFYKEQLVQRELNYCIVDEVDSILIDEARTPLIISGASEDATSMYGRVNSMIPLLKRDEDFEVDEKGRSITMTDDGVMKCEQILGIDNLYDSQHISFQHHIMQGIKAHHLFSRDVDYIVKDGQVVIVDEFTGRLMPGRRFSDGLHQALEAKEGVKVESENQTLASITFQNYFRMYNKLAGMTGTADTESVEFAQIYDLEVIVIPTNTAMIRKDFPDSIYKTQQEKYNAIADDIAAKYKKGQPVLVGTVSIEKSELVSSLLKKRKIPHNVLNAKHHQQEAEIVAEAGHKGHVTIATNMAGRGTDIKLGEGVLEIGGLHIIGTERHESRRIDNQLRGRSGRQGDPGSTRFYLALDDDLMRLFGSDRIAGIMDKLGMEEGEPIENGMVTKAIENSQKKVEGHNFEIRKQLLDYDNVMNQQREVIYTLRRDVMYSEDMNEMTAEFVEELFDDAFYAVEEAKGKPLDAETEEMVRVRLDELFGINRNEEFKEALPTREQAEEWVSEILDTLKESAGDHYHEIQRYFLLEALDRNWKEHLLNMDHLREGIGLRGYGQKDPKHEYKREGFELFREMLGRIKENTVRALCHLRIETEVREDEFQHKESKSDLEYSDSENTETKKKPKRRSEPKVGRNDPCPCGSGKKYKKCCGK
ncbi:preprotein translocase subunit SecA [Maridesulfovibrio salexigens]|uniref:Protein translocase subunit SecA n=1 Tax=Maridesulfovibrio salexigens (strain ATCC 14822 / DSM 2638 / NCIMB 8403 / VKM B-1763) TaxID=526222 RepID=SECA_MARSD|nr:preprotein translocase subunit SecA [Maridesulfovibrio salexigens]C6BVR6.1 RecName: Full=Protein translocase subunit SecA [Maridesulfovibrio salexigens DSM 2638]ACS78280.1 preprotein translocase, SecA subunit [Maridesulfovibrio salexigens DSM 2638]